MEKQFRSFTIQMFHVINSEWWRGVFILGVQYFRKLPKKFYNRHLLAISKEKGGWHCDILFIHLF